MEERPAGGWVRLFPPLTVRAAIPVLAVALTMAAGLLQAQVPKPEAHGYFSLTFSQGPKSLGPSNIGGLQGALLLNGLLSDRMEYRLELRGRSGSPFALEEAWLGLNLAAAFNVRAGLYLVPFGRFNRFNRPHESLFIRTPLPAESVYPESWRDLGLLASGQAGFFVYALSLGNGLGEDESFAPVQQFGDNNASKDAVARLGIQWREGLETAVSYSRQVFSAGGSGRRADLLGADASWVTKNYQVMGEYMRVERDAAPDGNVKTEGWYVLLALDYKTLWPLAAYQTVRSDPAAEGQASRRTRWTLGMAWALYPGVLLKAGYDWNREPGAEVENDVLNVQLAASF